MPYTPQPHASMGLRQLTLPVNFKNPKKEDKAIITMEKILLHTKDNAIPIA